MAGTGETPGDSPPGPDDINNRLAEIAAELAAEAHFKEPSAAERAQAAAARRASQARKPARPAPDRGYPTASGRHGRGTPLIAFLTVIAALFAVSAGLHVLLHRASSSSPGAARSARATPAVSPLFTTASPFANSPAQDYADGQAGIVLPVAGPVGAYTAAQVASAYQTVKQFLIAANLNWPTLEGGRPTAFAALLIPGERTWFDASLNKTGLTRQGVARSTRAWVTSFYPGSAEFVGTVIKVDGSPMTASVVDDHGSKVLSVLANYIFVYAVQQPAAPSDRARVVTHVQMTVEFGHWTDAGGPLQPWVTDVSVSHAGALCGETDGFVHPQFSEPGKVTPSGLANPYDLGTPIKPGTCQAATGT